MLTVWCVNVGTKYSDDYVHRLENMVARNIKQPFIFKCLSDHNIEGVHTVLTPVDWPGWWQKLYLFKLATKGKHLYFDLDVVITGPIDDLVSDFLTLPKNWAQSGHGGCQSSVMAWGEDYSYIADCFDPDLLSEPANGNYGYYGSQRLWGDQEYITALLGNPGAGRIAPMGGVYSYKYHCQSALPNNAKVVCFHGLPKPDQVTDEWVVNARRHSC